MIRTWALYAICLLALPLWGQGELHKVWDIRLDQRIPGGVKSPPVWGLGFSPDSKRLAIEIGEYVLVIPLDQPQTTLAQFTVGMRGGGEGEIRWSPNGERLIVDGSHHFVIDLKSGIECGLVDQPWWLDESRFLVQAANPLSIEEHEKRMHAFDALLDEFAAKRISLAEYEERSHALWPSQSEPGVSTFSVLGPGCKVETQWKLPGNWSPVASPPGKVAMQTPDQDFVLVDTAGQVTRRFPQLPKFKTPWVYLDAASAACGQYLSPTEKHYAAHPDIVRCFDLDSGKMIAEKHVETGRFSAGGTRISTDVLKTHYPANWRVSLAGFFDVNEPDEKRRFQRRIVWDIRAQSELASWKPRSGHSAFALSEDGKLLAEGDAGSVQLYRVE